jgi:hypothetical protein
MLTLYQQLQSLESARDRALRDAAIESVRLRRQTARALSPSRLVRRYPVASLLAAAAIGFLLVPSKSADNSQSRRHGLRFLIHRLAHLRQSSPKESSSNNNHAPHKSLPDQLLGVVTHLLSQLNWSAILRALVTGLRQKHSSSAASSQFIPRAESFPRSGSTEPFSPYDDED